jgi:hypothetical protein
MQPIVSTKINFSSTNPLTHESLELLKNIYPYSHDLQSYEYNSKHLLNGYKVKEEKVLPFLLLYARKKQHKTCGPGAAQVTIAQPTWKNTTVLKSYQKVKETTME